MSRVLKRNWWNRYKALKDTIRKRKTSPILPQNQNIVTDEKVHSEKPKSAHRLSNGIATNLAWVSKKESLSTLDTGFNPRMGHLELDHYGYLLGKIARLYGKGENPHKEVFEFMKLTNLSSLSTYLNDGKPI